MTRLNNNDSDKFMDKVIIFLIVFMIFNASILSTTVVSGQSMYPSFNDGDIKILTKYNTRPSQLKNGEVVVFKITGKFLIKRVIGLPGDTFEIVNNKTYINNTEIPEEYTNTFSGMDSIEKFIIPEGQIFVMGDNRDDSMDSRYFGPININTILGKVIE